MDLAKDKRRMFEFGLYQSQEPINSLAMILFGFRT